MNGMLVRKQPACRQTARTALSGTEIKASVDLSGTPEIRIAGSAADAARLIAALVQALADNQGIQADRMLREIGNVVAAMDKSRKSDRRLQSLFGGRR